MPVRFYQTLLIVAVVCLTVGCNTLAKRSDTGVVVARRAQIRSSTAVVAADLLEVNRGDAVEILEIFEHGFELTRNSRLTREGYFVR